MALNAYRYRFYGGDSGAEQAFLLSMYAKGYTAASVMNATDQVLTGKGTTKIGSSGTQVAVSNTITKTTLITQALGAAQAGDEFVFTAWGDCLNQTGSSQLWTIDVALGATTLGSGSTGTLATSGNRRRWWFEMNMVVTSTTAQSSGGIMTFGPLGTTSFTLGTTGAQGGFYAASTEDLSTSKDLTFSVTLGSANTTHDFRLGGYSVARRR